MEAPGEHRPAWCCRKESVWRTDPRTGPPQGERKVIYVDIMWFLAKGIRRLIGRSWAKGDWCLSGESQPDVRTGLPRSERHVIYVL